MESKWPLFGNRSTYNPYFKIEGQALYAYVDIPNLLISYFLGDLDALCEGCETDLEKLYTEAEKLKDEFNASFREKYGDWLSILIRKEPFGKRPFGIQIRIDWNLYRNFLEKFAEREDIDLEEKYEYLFSCRSEIAWMRKEPSKKFMGMRVKSISRNSIKKIKDILTSAVKELYGKRAKYRGRFLKRKFASLLLAYMPEMISTLSVIDDCASKGIIATCYREMRKILENISWVIVDDLLFLRENKELGFIPPLRVPTGEWYKWASDKGLIIKGLNGFAGSFVKKIMEKYGVERSKVEKSLFSNMAYSLFLFLAKSEEMPPTNLGYVVYETEKIKPFLKENVRTIMVQLLNRPLLDSDEDFVNELVDYLATKERISIRYPSNSFIMQLLGKTSGIDISKLYGRYSYFVHSYDKAWQFYPFSSVLEFKIFEHEVTHFIKLIVQLLDFYERAIRLRHRRKMSYKLV